MSANDAERREKVNAQNRARYARLKAEHRCVLCGAQDERTLSGMTRCEKCAQSEKDYYQMRKKYHLCVNCGKEDAYTMMGRSYCYECESRITEYHRKRYKERSIETGISPYANMYNKRAAQGLCVRCGAPALPGMVKCAYHRKKALDWARRYEHRKSEERRIVFGERGVDICLYCDNPPLEDRKICAECLEKRRATAARNFANNSTQNHPWKAWNNIIFKPRNRGDSDVQGIQPDG